MKPVRHTRRHPGTAPAADFFSWELSGKRFWCVLVTLQNLDCTTKGSKLDLGMSVVHGAEQALSPARRRIGAAMSVGFKGCLVDDAAFQRSGVQIEGVIRGKMNFDGAAEILHNVNAAAEEVAVKHDVPRGSLHAN